MSQVTSYVIPGSPLTMAGLKTSLDNMLGAAVSQNRGASAPSNPIEGMIWLDSSGDPVEVLKVYRTSGWKSLLSYNNTTGAITYYRDVSGTALASAFALTLLDDANATAALETLGIVLGTGAGHVVQLDASARLPAVNGSLLTNIAFTLGAANQKLFTNAAGNAREWGTGIKAALFTRAINGASGDVSYTGAGFKPSAVFIFMYEGTGRGSIGFATAEAQFCIPVIGDTGGTTNDRVVSLMAAYAGQAAVVKSFDADGITMTYTLVSSPGAYTAYGVILYIR